MSTTAQIQANQANSQHSTGPKSDAGKGVSSRNNFRHGLTGAFSILDWECAEHFQQLTDELFTEHQPATLTEELLVENMAQSHWLRKRAINLQNMTLASPYLSSEHQKELALYLRYQTTHDRAFYKALNELQKLRAEKRKQEIGFVSQQRKDAQEKRHDAREIRGQEMHNARLRLTEAQACRHEAEIAIAELTKLPDSNSENAQLNLAKAA